MIINLDIHKLNEITDYGFKVNPPSPYFLYFRPHDKNYVLDYSKNISITLTIKSDITNRIDVVNLTSAHAIEMNDEKLFKWQIPNEYLDNDESYTISPKVVYNGLTYVLGNFKLYFYSKDSKEMNQVLVGIKKFNEMYNKYLLAIKRHEIGIPNGIIPLNSDGKIDISYMQPEWSNHIQTKLNDTIESTETIHGMRINSSHYNLEYYDNVDNEWYIANSIFGGRFGYQVKTSTVYRIFGGYFSESSIPKLDAGNFNFAITEMIDSSLFTINVNELNDAGNFKDILPNVSGGGFTEKADPIEGGEFG